MAVQVSKEMIIKEINQIPDEKNDELYKLVHSFKYKARKHKKDNNFKNFLLKAPVWGEEELKEMEQVREWMNKWTIDEF